jgi:cytochrome c oxidase subunit IV
MILTIITVAVSRIDLGRLNVVVALAVAFTKASLVILYFMHVKYNNSLTKLTAACGFLWLIFMFVITFADYLTRGWSSALGRSW